MITEVRNARVLKIDGFLIPDAQNATMMMFAQQSLLLYLAYHYTREGIDTEELHHRLSRTKNQVIC